MMTEIGSPRLRYASDPDEEFLVAEIEAGDCVCCQVLKKEISGSVFFAFYRPSDRKQILIEAADFLTMAAKAVEEVKKIEFNRDIEEGLDGGMSS